MKFYFLLIHRCRMMLLFTACSFTCSCVIGQLLPQDGNNIVQANETVLPEEPLNFENENHARPSSSPFVFSVNTFNTNCGRHEGGIAVRATNGIPPYQYKIYGPFFFDWRDNGLFGNLPAGNYKVYAKDATGAIDSADAVITNMFDPPVLSTADFFPQFSHCDSDSTLPSYTLLASGGQPPYLYSYDFISFQSSPVFTNLYKGTYTFGVKDANGCTATFYGLILPSSCRFTYAFAMASSVCGNKEIGLITPWYYGATSTRKCMISVDGAPEVFRDATAYGPGLHIFHIRDTVTNDTTNLVATTLSVCRLTVDTIVKQADCGVANGTIKLTGRNGIPPYLFSTDGFNFSAADSFYNLKQGIYTCAVKDADNKVAFTVIYLTANCPMIVNTSAVPSNCGLANGSIKVFGEGGTLPYTYAVNGVNFQTGNIFNGLAAGTYMVRIKDAEGFKDSVSVEVTGGVCFSVSATPVNATCTRPGSITASCQNGIPPISYSLNGINYQSGPFFSGLQPGIYEVYAQNSNGVIDSTAVTVLGTTIPKFSLGSDTNACKGITILLSPDNIYTNTSYLWNNGAISNSISVSNDSSYWLKVTNTDGCVWIDTINVNFKSLPVFDLGLDTFICEKDALTLNASVINATNYLWNDNSIAPQIKVYRQNWYWCEVSKDGCSYRDSLYLTVKPLPIVNLGIDTTLCEGTTIQLNAYNDNASYRWQDNSMGSNYTVSKENKYSVTVNKDGCIVKDTINIHYSLKPVFSLGNDQLICTGQSIVLKPPVDAAWQLIWQDGSAATYFTVTKAGTYSLEATNKCGNKEDEIIFTEGLCDIYIPSAFTPNNDRWNNEFKVLGTGLVSQFHLQIFNRYGHLVFETTDKNKGWDGLYKTLPAEAGAYVYLLQYRDNKDRYLLRGSFLLIR